MLVRFTRAPFDGYHLREFINRAAAEEWVNAQSDLYWHQIVCKYPSSKQKLPVINFKPSQEEYLELSGHLDTYFETGMECMGLIFEDENEILRGEKNPAFDTSKPESDDNFSRYKKFEALHFLKQGMILEVDGFGRIGLVKDHAFAKEDEFALSFYPQGFSKAEWIKLFQEKVKAKLWIKKT